jgi:hypothetical protein
LKEKSLHDELKQWLIDLGKSVKDKRGNPYYSETWSGDSKSVDLRVGRKHDTDRPDVIWKYKGEKGIFQIAFQETWREIAGEICLASMVEDCSKIFIITYVPRDVPPEAEPLYKNRWTNFVSMVGEKVGLKYGATLIFISYNQYEHKEIEAVKSLILARLKDDDWVW